MGDAALREKYDAMSAVYDRDRVDAFFQKGLDALHGKVAPFGSRVLEVGCGTGRYVAGLRKRDIEAYGIDFSERMCEIARQQVAAAGIEDPTSVIRQADVEQTLAFDETFSAIVVMDCWELLPDPRAALETIRGGLDPEGRLFIFTPRALARPLITTLEFLRIKKLRPAFNYGNSAPSTVRRLANGLFEVVRHETLFFGLESVFELEPVA